MDYVLFAVGRLPNTSKLNLPSDINVRSDGSLIVDEYENTSRPGVYALGDITKKVDLTPVAIAAGRRLADRLFGSMSESKIDYTNIPSVVFTHPSPCGSIGLTEVEARKAHDDVKIYKSSFTNMYYGMMNQEDKAITKYKIVCAGSNEQVIGLHMIGKASDEILQGFGVAIKMGATKADFDRCIAIHPTASEELVTMT